MYDNAPAYETGAACLEASDDREPDHGFTPNWYKLQIREGVVKILVPSEHHLNGME